ncbi:MAG: hypothetical protein ACLUKO_09965 [Enterocloster bolteae]
MAIIGNNGTGKTTLLKSSTSCCRRCRRIRLGSKGAHRLLRPGTPGPSYG